MKLRLPFIGEIKTGRDIQQLPTITAIETGNTEKLLDVLGGFLQFTPNRLSDEKMISGKLLLANKEWVYRNNDVIAQEVSKIEFELFSVGLKDGDIIFNEVQEHPLLDLLDRFNTTTTRMDGIYVTQSDKKLAGDAFWLLDKNGKVVQNIFILPPDKVELKLGDPTDGTANLVEGYTYKDVIDGKQITVEYTRDQIIHFKKPNPRNPFRGLGAVEALADTIDSDNLTNQMQRSFFEKGAISNFVLTTDSKITEDQLKRIQAEFRGMYAGAKNAFKCLAPETEVQMADGRVLRADEVKSGDLVVSWEDNKLKPAKVVGVEWQPESPLYEVRTEHGRVIQVTANHPFLVKRKNKSKTAWKDSSHTDWVEAIDLQEDDKLMVALGWQEDTRPDTIDEYTSWILGAWAGDRSTESQFSAGSGYGQKIIERFQEKYDVHYKGRADYYIRGISKLLREHEIFHSVARTKVVPKAVILGSKNIRAAFLAGYLDTDGHVSDPEYRNSAEVSWTSVNYGLLKQCQSLLANLNVNATITSIPGGFRLCVFGNNQAAILAEILDVAHPQKSERLKTYADKVSNHDRSRTDKVKSVMVLDSRASIGIEVEGTHTHVTEGLITHNTMVFGNGLKPSPVGFSNKDMQFLDLLTWYRDKIMIGFGNTKASLGIVDDVNRASFDGAYGGWLRSTVKPDMDSIVGTINEFLVPMFGNNLILGYKDPVPEDSSDEITTAIALKQAGIMKVNEAREVAGLDSVDGGDMFAPTAGVSYPGQPDPTLSATQDPTSDNNSSGDVSNTDNNSNGGKILRRLRYKSTVPSALAHLDVNKILRSQKMFTQQRINREAKAMAKPLIRYMLESKKKQIKNEPESSMSTQFTNERLNDYYAKQIHIVDVLEGRFEKAVLVLLGKVQDAAVHNLENEIGTLKGLKRAMSKNKALFNEEDLKVQAQLDLTPLLMQELILAGEEAYRLIGVEDTYIPYKVAEAVRVAVDKFATSMFETDRKVLAGIISEGIEAGQSIPEMSSALREKFGQYSKMQAERITRTETIRVSNMAAEDAFIQSGVVEAKQWLVAPNACPLCQPYSGKIVGLGQNFYEPDDSGFQSGNPGLHVNCKCILIPVVIQSKAYIPTTISERETLQAHISDLESQIDKRTKAFKDAQQERADDKAYIKALETQLKRD